jgi:hypothetical protein
MTENLIDKVKALVARHDYIVTVTKTEPPLTCEAEFPNSNINRQPLAKDIVKYNLKDNPYGICVTDKNGNEEFWGCPVYARRFMVICDIMRRARKIPIHQSLIRYCINKDENEYGDSLSDLLPGPTDENDKSKESFLGTLLTKAIEDKFPAPFEEVAETHGVGTGYRLLKGFF